MSDPAPRNSRPQRIAFAVGVILPCVLFLGAMVSWWTTGGRAIDGGPAWSGLALVGGVAVIVGFYLLADRYWIRRR